MLISDFSHPLRNYFEMLKKKTNFVNDVGEASFFCWYYFTIPARQIFKIIFEFEASKIVFSFHSSKIVSQKVPENKFNYWLHCLALKK